MLPPIEFTVSGKPPTKDRKYKTGWSDPRLAPRVKLLREKAFEACAKAGFRECYPGAVHLELTVYAPNITDLSRSHTHVGDIDKLIAGVFEALQPAHEHAMPYVHEIFKDNPNIVPSIPLVVKDDTLIVSVTAKKVKSQDERYTVKVTPLE